MRKVACLGDCPSDSLVTMFKQGVEIVDERLHFGGIAPFNPILFSFSYFRESRPQLVELVKPFLDGPKPTEHEGQSEAAENHGVTENEIRRTSKNVQREKGNETEGAEESESRGPDQPR